MTGRASTKRSALISEREFLLASLDDLEAEYQAGDLDDADYEQLKADYTVRAAAVIRQLDTGPREFKLRGDRPRRRLGLWVIGLAVFAVLAGFGLAQAVGERGVNDQITGDLPETPREQVLRCQVLGQDPTTLADSLSCFDEVLDEDPDNVEALAYRGWYVFLASRSAENTGDSDAAAELMTTSALFLDRAVEADPTFPDSRAFRVVVAERLGQREAACIELAQLVSLEPPDMILGLVSPVAERLDCLNL